MIKRVKDNNLYLKKLFFIITDIAFFVLAISFALFVRYDFSIDKIPIAYIENVRVYMWMDVLLSLIFFSLLGLYKGLWKFASIKELFNIIIACTLAYGSRTMLMSILDLRLPRSVYVLGYMILVVLVFGTRFSYRFLRYVVYEISSTKNMKKVMIIGAGDAGNMLIREISSSRTLKSKIVCIIDDNKNLKGLYIQGIEVVGGREYILDAVKKYDVDEIILAIPSASYTERRSIFDIAKQTKCSLKTVPGLYQIINNEIKVSDLKDVQIEDLLGRDAVNINIGEIKQYIENKTVLVTGAGGSIGSELCRQLAKLKPSSLVMLDIYENNMYEIQQELVSRLPDLNLHALIANVRDEKRLLHILSTHKPDIVFHAAAHKHVPLMEDSPNEAIKNNVFGTLALVKAADQCNVKRFIMISTDKAVHPTNIMGASKRMCEMIVQTYNYKSDTEFVAVRFGNVLGSNGSVIPLFKKQIERGGPVTVTHENITRYFMTIPEAVSLVLQAGYYAKGGEIFVLDMGEPIRIYELAENMIRLSGREPNVDIDIAITGLRPGEKLYEELLMDEEGISSTKNKLIFIGHPIEIDSNDFYSKLDHLKEILDNEAVDIREYVADIVTTYNRMD